MQTMTTKSNTEWNPSITPIEALDDSNRSLPTERIRVSAAIDDEANAKAEKYSGASSTVSGRSAHMLMLQGILGEEACCRLLGCDRDTRVYTDHGDGGVDLEKNSISVNVKTKLHAPPLLMVPEYEDIVCDAYVVCEIPEMTPDTTRREAFDATYDVRIWGVVPSRVVQAIPADRSGPRSDVADRIVAPDQLLMLES